MRPLPVLAVLAAVTGCAGCRHVAGGAPVDLATVRLPAGFTISVYVDKIPGARSLARGPGGTLFIGTRDDFALGRVWAVVDRDGDQRADERYVIASGLHSPNGVAVHDGALYVAETSRVLRFDDIEQRLATPPAPAVVNDSFPGDSLHGWKYLRFSPDGQWLYVPVGVPCDSCEREDDPRFGSIMRMHPDGSGLEIFARGIRNTVGFDFDPKAGELWLTENGRDGLGDGVPPDELNHAPAPGMHFGFPWCDGRIDDPDHRAHGCAGFTPPAFELDAHAAALGMRFYDGAMFPDEYHGAIFIAEHGSAHRSQFAGYRISVVHMQNGAPVSYGAFADGFLQNGDSWARPVDVLVMPDGALLFSDDRSDAVYRIAYAP
jgi:glucose/arabinose dehydrogenase